MIFSRLRRNILPLSPAIPHSMDSRRQDVLPVFRALCFSVYIVRMKGHLSP